MWLRQACSVLLALSVLFAAAPVSAEGQLALYRDGQIIGTLSTVERGSHTMVDAGAMAKLLGAQSSEKNDTLVIMHGRSKLQLVLNAAAAWLGVELLPMASPAVKEGDAWLLDSRSALKLFNGLLERGGSTPSLQWKESAADAGSPIPPAGTKPPTATQPPKAEERPTPLPKGGSSAASLPVLRALRWGGDDGTYRVVFDLSGPGEPIIQRSAGKFSLQFALPAPATPFESPADEIEITATTSDDRLTVELASSLPLKEVITLEGPRRIVLDYVRASTSTPDPAPRGEEPPRTPGKETRTAPKRNTKRIVVIDPGHGGKDPGAVANGIREKDINLAVSKYLLQRLEKMGYDARLTRSTDVYLTLQERTDLAHEWNADAFVSMHVNALPPGRHATGMEIYLMALPTDKDAMQLAKIENAELAEGNGDAAKAADKRTQTLLNILGNMQQNAKITESTDFAEYLFNAGKGGGIQMRRVAQAPFFVLRGASMPAVLVEMGFLTEKKEARLLAAKAYQERMATAIAAGIEKYLTNN